MILVLLLSFVLGATSAHAAATCVDAGATEVHEDSSTSPKTISYTTPPGSNQITFMGFGYRNGTVVTVSGVTIGGDAGSTDLAQLHNAVSGGTLWYRKSPPAGTNNVVFTFSATPSQGHFIIFTCSDVDLTAFRSSTTGTGATATPTITLASVATGDVLVDFVATDDVNLAIGANQTEIHTGTAGATSMAGASYQNGADGGVMSWTITADDWVSLGYALKPAQTTIHERPVMFP